MAADVDELVQKLEKIHIEFHATSTELSCLRLVYRKTKEKLKFSESEVKDLEHNLMILQADNLDLKQKVVDAEAKRPLEAKCAVCLESNKRLAIWLPCHHQAVCEICLKNVGRACPLCRRECLGYILPSNSFDCE